MNTHFIVLKKATYVKIQAKFNVNEQKKQLAILKVMPFLDKISIRILENLVYYF